MSSTVNSSPEELDACIIEEEKTVHFAETIHIEHIPRSLPTAPDTGYGNFQPEWKDTKLLGTTRNFHSTQPKLQLHQSPASFNFDHQSIIF